MAYKTSPETEKKKQLMKQNIIKTALKLFEQNGYTCTTIKEIVNKSGTSVGNFYFYFKNKEELFELFYDEMDDLLQRVSKFSLNHGSNGVVSGFCRSKASELWTFQNIKGFAKVLMIEAAGMNPIFEQKRSNILNNSNIRIEEIFIGLKQNDILDLFDAKIAAVMCNGTMYSVIMDWLKGNCMTNLTDFAYQIITYNLNAFKIDYNINEVKEYINVMIEEMEENFAELSKGLYTSCL